MSGTEAAASLFGSGDSSSDPFAALGTELSQETSDDLFAGVDADNSVQSPGVNPFDSLDDQQTLSSNTAGANHSQPAVQAYSYPSDPYASTHSASGTSEPHGAYGTSLEWNNSQSYNGTNATNSTSYDARQYTPPAPRDPYAPPQVLAYAPPSSYQAPVPQPSTLPHPGKQTAAYDAHNAPHPYTPSQPATKPSYTPYNSYVPTTNGKPNVSPYEPPYAVSQTSYASPPPPPSKASLATVPSPPVPTTTQITRPKISNAYDPPFPVTSYNRRNVSGPAKLGQAQTLPAHSAYAAYQPATSPPLPPPPPRAPVSSGYAPHQPTQAPIHGASYAPPMQPSSVQSVWNSEDGTSTVVRHHTHADYNSSVPPQLPSPEPYIPPSDTLSQSQRTPGLPSDQRPDVPDSAASGAPLQGEPGANFSTEYGAQESLGDLEEYVAVSPPNLQYSPGHAVLADPSSSVSTSPKVNYASLQSPTASVTTSPQKPFKALSPPPRSTGHDLGPSLSPRQSPRPTSTSSSVYALPNSLRASPELRRSSVASPDYLPRARTTSPGVDGLTNKISPAPPKGYATRSQSTSVASLDRFSLPESSSFVGHDRHAPRGARFADIYAPERTGSPSSFSTHSSDSRQSNKPQLPSYLPPVSESPYTPPSQEPTPAIGDPYAPSQHTRNIKLSPTLGYGQVVNGYNPELSPPREAGERSTIAPYAPSPSLLGANDPLGRTSVRVPVVSFGFGGKLITCFHNEGMLNTGFDVALSSRTSTKVQLQNWKKLIPESALDSVATFPGPLYADPGPPSTGIMKATISTQAKTKKAQVVKYLSDRVEEITQGLSYQHNGSVEKRMAEGKLVLVKLLKIMVENDGRLLGTPQLDSAVRVALVPRLEGLVSRGDSANFTSTADAAALLSDNSYGSLGVGADVAPISVTTLRIAALDKIEEFLLRGERRQACHYALDEKLWAHAMVIASSIDKETWKEVVGEFIRAELGVKGETSFTLPGRTDVLTSNGREGLRVAYSLFSGQGAAAVQELVPRSVLARASGRLPLPTSAIPASALAQLTPRTPSFSIPAAGTKVPVESLSRWAETAAMMISSPLTNEVSAALTALGDQLMTNGWLEAAHACYLLSPQTAPLGGVGNPTARIVLLGSRSPATLPTFSKDPDSIIFTEILEYALATAHVPKGQEPSHGIPHLQAYRLLRAFAAAEAGDLNLASRYCEAITASLIRGSPYFTPVMLEQLKGLVDRLSGVSHSDKPNSWMAGKISKPSLDTIGGWLEGRFTKLVTGDSDSPSSPQEDAGRTDTQSYTGPFAHYNTISSTTSSARSSPAPSFVTPAYALPSRTESATSMKASYGYGIDRSSSAMEPPRRNSPGPAPPQALSANAVVTSFPSIQTQLNNRNYSNGYSPESDLQTPKPPHHDDNGGEANAQEVTWWGSSGYGDTGKTPTAAHFEKVEARHEGADSNGFFSPMAGQMFAIAPQSSISSRQPSSYDNEDDDLGLGNSMNKRKNEAATEVDSQEAKPISSPAKEEEKKPETQPAQSQSSGWFSRWWRRENTSGGPVKASLGEESSFYYDKDLKRWVNKKAGAEEPKPTPPPPPPRAQTASPAMTGPKPSGPAANGTANGNGLGARPASAIDLTSPPTNKTAMRVRSNLAPPGLDSAPPTPTGTRLTPSGTTPPPSRPKSQASQKRSIRSRYVDVFAQEGGKDA